MTAPDLNRLRWRCRRGMLELDAWLTGFLEHGYSTLDPAERAVFADLLGEEDADLHDWLSGRGPPPERYRNLLNSIRKVHPT